MITDLTPQQVLTANVDNKPQPEPEAEIEEKIRKATRMTSFTLRLSQPEVEHLKRCASIVDLKWEQFLTQQIREKVLQRSGHVAAPLITAPSFASKRVSGPSSLS
jgi:predicted DNA binding CopG/RHH family protein